MERKHTCPSCGRDFKKLGSHLAVSACEHPEFTDYQEELLTGLMFGDGWVNHHSDSGNPYFAVGMTNREFLEWLNEELQPHTTGVKDASGSQNSKEDYYKIRTIRNPHLEDVASWYGDDGLRLQEVELTPTVLKMWFVSDGGADNRSGRPYAAEIVSRIGTRSGEGFLESLFENTPVTPTVRSEVIYFDENEAQRLIEYIGEAPPGFEYKWPDEDQVTLGGGD